MIEVSPLDASALFTACDTSQFDFKTTAELEDLHEFIGQTRAREALQFGIGIDKGGYNLFVMGPPGIGKRTMVQQYLEQETKDGATPSDICYINNFEQPHKPFALQLPSGCGHQLQSDMSQLVEDLRAALPVTFESDEYHSKVREIEEKYETRRKDAFQKLVDEAETHNILLKRTPTGFALLPTRDDKPLTPKEFSHLPQDEQKRIEEISSVLEEKLTSLLHQLPQLGREARQEIKELNRETTLFTVKNMIDELKEKYAELPVILDYLDAIQNDVIDHFDEFQGQESSSMFSGQERESAFMRRYQVNLLVDHSKKEGVPIIYEDNPSYQRLFGRVEHVSQMGTLITDFTLIKPGSLHQATGGYLILDVAKVLTRAYSWEALKRALYSQEICIQSLGELFSLVSTVSLEPEPIPLDLKVVLLGDRLLYYLLMYYDPEFLELFKVAADFEERMIRNDENNQIYAQLIATQARKEQLLPFTPNAVGRVIEQSARIAEDAERLTTHMLSIVDLMRESDYWARDDDAKAIDRVHVQKAIDAQIHRHDRLRERVYEAIQRKTIHIESTGDIVGQVNGLAVIDQGNFAFARPSRITATARLGEGEVIDIEREAELGGAVHSKGVMILTSFLAGRYAINQPLSLYASITFEQSYGMVEGDSASLGELCALLSVLASLPIKQSFAITGSVDQLGHVQAIGGVNEKIEGFYDICKERELTGEQGVLIPEADVKFLMLRDDVIQSVRDGRFKIYAVKTVDEAMTVLTGVDAGEADAQGNFPEGTVNYRVNARLLELADTRRQFSAEKSSTQKSDSPVE